MMQGGSVHVRAVAPGAAAALLLVFGCAREAPELREVRLEAQRYVNALARKDLDELRSRSTCVVPHQFVQGGNVLRIGDLRRTRLGTLDSLARATSERHREVNLKWMQSREAERESLFQVMQVAGRTDIIYRNAIRAIDASEPDSLHGSDTAVETRTLRIRIRYAGMPVGPKAVDREHVLRMLRTPTGRWIAFSLYSIEDDPRPAGV